MTEEHASRARGGAGNRPSGSHLLEAAETDDPGSAGSDNLHLWLAHLAITADRLLEAAGRLEEALERGEQGAPAGQLDAPAGPDRLFRREGDYWTIAYRGRTVRLHDLKGLTCLAHLLSRPGTEVHVIDLAAAASDGARPDASSSGPRLNSHGLHVDNRRGDALLDPQAKAAYRRRLEELEDELAEARRFHDTERAWRAQEERDALVAQLAEAVGLGGRDRRAASAAERTRVNVTRTIRAAIGRIGTAHPSLGRHLAVSVRTGTFCCYDPDPGAKGTWSL